MGLPWLPRDDFPSGAGWPGVKWRWNTKAHAGQRVDRANERTIMPLLRIQTNTVIEDQKTQSLLKVASQRLATALGKPEQYMMVSVESGLPMMFAGKQEPTAFAELRGIGQPPSKTGQILRFGGRSRSCAVRCLAAP
jgi:hypothetical protein